MREAYAQEKHGEPSVLEAFVKSELGNQTWIAHYELDVQICDNQSEWTPLQRQFLMLAFDEYGPDTQNLPNEVKQYGR